MEVALVRVTPDGKSQRAVLSRPRTLIGRQEDCQLRLPIAGVSRTHCEILVEDGHITINDLGSSNGTYLNQERITSHPAAAGDLLSVGGQVFLIQVNGDPEEIEPEFLYEDGLPEQSATAPTTVSPPQPKVKAQAGGSADGSSLMEFDFEDEEEQPPL